MAWLVRPTVERLTKEEWVQEEIRLCSGFPGWWGVRLLANTLAETYRLNYRAKGTDWVAVAQSLMEKEKVNG